jgi:hypothetical protein
MEAGGMTALREFFISSEVPKYLFSTPSGLVDKLLADHQVVGQVFNLSRTD